MTDPITPDYYRFPSGVEVIDISEYLTGNGAQVVQYVARATRTDGVVKGSPVEDLRKAALLLQREIERLEDASQDAPTWEFHQYGGALIAKRVNQ